MSWPHLTWRQAIAASMSCRCFIFMVLSPRFSRHWWPAPVWSARRAFMLQSSFAGWKSSPRPGTQRSRQCTRRFWRAHHLTLPLSAAALCVSSALVLPPYRRNSCANWKARFALPWLSPMGWQRQRTRSPLIHCRRDGPRKDPLAEQQGRKSSLSTGRGTSFRPEK